MRMIRTLARGIVAATVLPALAAGSIATGAAAPSTPHAWAPDRDDQYLLDVSIRQLRLGDGVRAYGTPEGTCVLLGDFLATLDVAMRIDLAAKKASGWAFKESNKISIDLGSGQVAYGGGKQEMLSTGTVRQTSEGWCVDAAALSRWFGIGVRPSLAGSALLLISEAKLPVEMARERRDRAARIRSASTNLDALPQVRLPYRMFRAPALDFVVSGGVTYDARGGTRIDRRAAILAAGELATLSYEAHASTDTRGLPDTLRIHAYKSDPAGGLLGPLGATHFGVGDVEGWNSRLVGTGNVGRGAVVTNRPLFNPTAFDRTRFEGDLPAGWEAELYRNGELLAFSPTGSNQRYRFDDVQLHYGENRIEILLYGPQGQVRSRVETVNVADSAAPPGKTWYWVGVNQPGRDLIDLRRDASPSLVPKVQATAALEHGVDKNMSVGLAATMQLVDDERLTFVEGTVRRSVGRALVEVSAVRDSSGGLAGRASLLARLGTVNVAAEALVAEDFRLANIRERRLRQARLSLDAPLRIGRALIPAHASVRVIDRPGGTRELEAAARLSANINRFNLGTDIRYRHSSSQGGPAPPDDIEAALIGSGRIGRVRVRGTTIFVLKPSARLKLAELSAYWSASEKADWEAGLGYDGLAHRARARISHIRRFKSMAIAMAGEGASDGSVAVGFNLIFSLDPARGFKPSRLPMASAGMVRAHVYRDLNDNGAQDPGEPNEPRALITTGNRVASEQTDKSGRATVAGLQTYQPIAVGIDESSLGDPTLTPRKALQVVTPRAGIAADVEIGLVGAGSVEGILIKDGGGGFEGVELELVDAAGKVVARATSDYDGYFLFERAAYGRYSVRIAATSARVIKAAVALDATIVVTGDKPVVRLGPLRPVRLPQVAGATMPTGGTN